MTIAALALSIVFFAVAFVWRSLVRWKRTGDFGFRLDRSAGSLPKVASALMVGGFLMQFGVVIGDLAGSLTPLVLLDRFPMRLAGVVLMAVALVVTTKAQIDLRDSWRVGVDLSERTDLVTDGLFGLVRNPIFSGMLAFAIGAALAVPSWLAIVGPIAVAIGLELQVRGVEEPYLVQVHGNAYRAYVRRVGRFVPGLGRVGA